MEDILEPDQVERNRRIAAHHAAVKSLVEAFAGRFDPRDSETLRTFIFVGEVALALDKLLGCLVRSQIAVTRDQRNALRGVIDNTGESGEYYLNVVPKTLESLKVVS